MKVICKNPKKLPFTFNDLSLGDVFNLVDNPELFYMKTYVAFNGKNTHLASALRWASEGELDKTNAVCLTSGHFFWFEKDSQVRLRDVELIIND
jgi:hypothetical protein